MEPLDPKTFSRIVFFTGAGMSAESGVPTYRGSGGIWHQYRYEEYACQEAFDRDPEKVLAFHELRRRTVLDCCPHNGHAVIAKLEKQHPGVTVVTQNIDGMHQRSGSRRVLELHGSLWRVRCDAHGAAEDIGPVYRRRVCDQCGRPLRPDIVWFGDCLDPEVLQAVADVVKACDLFVGIGTSGVVWPAAGFAQMARDAGALCVEINPEPNEMSFQYRHALRQKAGEALPQLFRPL